MVSYVSTKDNICNNHSHTTCEKIMQNEEESPEIEFEGWLQLGNPVRESGRNFIGRCQRSCSMVSPAKNYCQGDNCCSNNETHNTYTESGCRNSCGHSCGHNMNMINQMRRLGRCMNCSMRNSGHGRQLRNENEVYYVTNRQNAPTVVVQKPQTVVVRNKSRPPIVVQQPPPNVIVRNDPPQPIYVQNPPPNVTVRNAEPTGFRNTQIPPFGHFYRPNPEPTQTRQVTCGGSRATQNPNVAHGRTHCIHHCKHPCHLNFNM